MNPLPALLLFLATLVGAAAASDAPRPNILFIYTDDQSDRTVSSYEKAPAWVHTPHIDRLAERGVRFAHAYNGTWCMPARATFLTGLQPYAAESLRMAGTYPGSEYDEQALPFWLPRLRASGYTTAQIGKWHVGTDTGYGRDWDYQIVWNRPRYPENAGSYYYDQLVTFNGGEPRMVSGYATDNYTKWAVDYIRGEGRDPAKPWLLWLCYTGTHGPFTPAERHEGAIPADAEISLPVDMFGERPGKPDYVQRRAGWVKTEAGKIVTNRRPPRGGEYFSSVRGYHETAYSLDDGVGALMAALEATSQLENTLVIFTSDQGFAWGQHGFQHKMAPYDANLSCPLIVSFAGRLPEGEVCDVPVGGQDLVPTMMRFAGLEAPWALHGRDITPLLESPTAASDHAVLLSYNGRVYGSDTATLPDGPAPDSGIAWWVSYRRGTFKYIMNLIPGEMEELYDLANDPDELINLAAVETQAPRLREYRNAMLAELRRTDAPFVDQLPLTGTTH